MDLKIASRKSDLARIQSITVGEKLKAAFPRLNIQYTFKASLGDKNLSDPLWKMPQKGVFTEDFLQDLIGGKQDLVVHSWKDLPTENRPETEIYATLPREDVRDLLLFKKSSVEKLKNSGKLVCFSSSPRRIYNLTALLPKILPWQIKEVEFQTVRGNVPTRIEKLLNGEADALVVAKAAMDRLLEFDSSDFKSEFVEMQKGLRGQLQELLWMVLPVRENPPAAAQGALAIEIRRDRADLKALLDKINCSETFRLVNEERTEFKSYGGGCHQKIGLIRLQRKYGEIRALRGETESGKALDEWRLHHIETGAWPQARPGEIFPPAKNEGSFFDRERLSVDPKRLSQKDLWVARAEALPGNYRPQEGQIVWCAGMQSWQKLAERGIWVHGCAEALGENEEPRIRTLLGREEKWTKLTHSEGVGDEILPTYQLVVRKEPVDFSGRKFFYWMSGSQFLQAIQWEPKIVEAYHACGPGHTFDIIAGQLPDRKKLKVFLNYEDWRSHMLSGSKEV